MQQKIFSKAENRKCPVCGAANVFSDGKMAKCKACSSEFSEHDLKCIGKPIIFHSKKNRFICASCGLVLGCVSCGSTVFSKTSSVFVCQKCSKMQESEEIHEKEYKNQRYVRRFQEIMHSFLVWQHLSKNEGGRIILDWIQKMPSGQQWPNISKSSNSKRGNDKIATIAFAYRDYCRKNPL